MTRLLSAACGAALLLTIGCGKKAATPDEPGGPPEPNARRADDPPELTAVKEGFAKLGAKYSTRQDPVTGRTRHVFVPSDKTTVGDLKKLPTVPFPFDLDLSAMDPSSELLGAVKNVKNLTALKLSSPLLEPVMLRELADFKSLTGLALPGSRDGDALAEEVKGLKNLTELNLSYTRLTNAGLVHLKEMTNLTSLNLAGDIITEEGFVHLAELKNLKALDITETQVGGGWERDLQRSLPNCKITR